MSVTSRIAIVSVLVHVACTVEIPPCSVEVDKGDTLEVEIIERWDENSEFAFSSDYLDRDNPAVCGRTDVKAGQKFTLELRDDKTSLKCTDPLCPEDFPTVSEPHEGSPYPGQDYLCLRTDRKVRVSSTCEISRFVSLHRANRELGTFNEPETGKVPPVVLVLRYLGAEDAVNLVCDSPESVFPPDAENEGGAFVCTDNWVVKVTKR